MVLEIRFEDPEFGTRHAEPPDQAVKREKERFAETLNGRCCISDLCTVAIDYAQVHDHFTNRLAPEPFHHGPIGKKEECLEPEFKWFPSMKIDIERMIQNGAKIPGQY